MASYSDLHEWSDIFKSSILSLVENSETFDDIALLIDEKLIELNEIIDGIVEKRVKKKFDKIENTDLLADLQKELKKSVDRIFHNKRRSLTRSQLRNNMFAGFENSDNESNDDKGSCGGDNDNESESDVDLSVMAMNQRLDKDRLFLIQNFQRKNHKSSSLSISEEIRKPTPEEILEEKNNS